MVMWAIARVKVGVMGNLARVMALTRPQRNQHDPGGPRPLGNGLASVVIITRRRAHLNIH